MEQSVNTKAIKFRTLAEKRVSKAIKLIQQIGNLANRNIYDFTPDQVRKMFDAIEAELERAEHKFEPQAPKPKADVGFRFDV